MRRIATKQLAGRLIAALAAYLFVLQAFATAFACAAAVHGGEQAASAAFHCAAAKSGVTARIAGDASRLPAPANSLDGCDCPVCHLTTAQALAAPGEQGAIEARQGLDPAPRFALIRVTALPGARDMGFSGEARAPPSASV